MRVVVADDSVLLREGLTRLLTEAGADVVAAVGDAPSLVLAAVTHQPDVAIVDIRMPPTMTNDGLKAATEARAAVPSMGVLLLSGRTSRRATRMSYWPTAEAESAICSRIGCPPSMRSPTH